MKGGNLIMAWIKKIKEFATGKTEIERKREAQANRLIRERAMVAQLQERERQAIQFAKQREKISYDRRLKALKEPPKRFDGFGVNMGNSILGQAMVQPSRPVVKRSPKKKSKKKSNVVRRTIDPVYQQPYRVI